MGLPRIFNGSLTLGLLPSHRQGAGKPPNARVLLTEGAGSVSGASPRLPRSRDFPRSERPNVPRLSKTGCQASTPEPRAFKPTACCKSDIPGLLMSLWMGFISLRAAPSGGSAAPATSRDSPGNISAGGFWARPRSRALGSLSPSRMQPGSWQPRSRKPPLHRGRGELSRALIHGFPNRQTVALFLHSRKKRIKKGRGCVLQDCKIIPLQALSPRERWQRQERAPRGGFLASLSPCPPQGFCRAKPPAGAPLLGNKREKKHQGFFSQVEERHVNAEAIIQAGTWSWRAFSSRTLPEPQQFALCCSFIRRVIFVFFPLGEQDSFCFQCPFESSLLRIWFSREKLSWPVGFAPTLSGAEKQWPFHCHHVGVACLLDGKVMFFVPWEFIPAPLLLGFGYLIILR